MDKIYFFNSLVESRSKKNALETFLQGITEHYEKIEFFYEITKMINKSSPNLTILSSFNVKSKDEKENSFNRIMVQSKDIDNKKLCCALAKKVKKVENRFGKCEIAFKYNTAKNCIVIEIKKLTLH